MNQIAKFMVGPIPDFKQYYVRSYSKKCQQAEFLIQWKTKPKN